MKVFEDNAVATQPVEKAGRLWRWICFSGILHGVLIISFFLIPQTASRSAISYPVYSVELVGGEKIGGGLPEARVGRPSEKKVKKGKKKASPRVSVVKKVRKKEKARKAGTSKKVKRGKKQKPRSKVALLKRRRRAKGVTAGRRGPGTRNKSRRKTETREERGEELPSRVRERLIEAALDRVRQRAEATRDRKVKEETAVSGPGEGEGAAAPGRGGRGGGIVKGLEFLIYRNRMLSQIKERWTWVGKRKDLEVTVRFGIQENGEIVGLKIAKASGDVSYDESVIRAVERANPLPPPPSSYRRDFLDVELKFRPADLSQ